MSNMYSLLNFIAATSKDTHDATFQGSGSHEYGTLNSLENGLRGLSEDEKRLTGISTISVVTRLALEFGIEEVRVCHLSEHLGITDYSLLGHPTHRFYAFTTLALC